MTAYIGTRVLRDLADLVTNLREAFDGLDGVMTAELTAAIHDTARRAGNEQAMQSITMLRTARAGTLDDGVRAWRHAREYVAELEHVIKLLKADLPDGSLVVFTKDE